MATTVGPKGQVVIEKEIRERLGIQPGAMAIQRVVEDHVEIRFVPPPHGRSLRGLLQPYLRRPIPPAEWDAAREEAWAEVAQEQERSR